ncbi:replication initiator protein [Microvirus mar52]|uniref:Replication initiator protein n=1 Tax=Microvirus mar52 TaxID=2851188 RepID=A0A8F5MKS3_9VIRU|nr:replication initiator protein [Microvirus mar52]
MCLTPKVIVNPRFYNERHLFEYICADGVMHRQPRFRDSQYYYPAHYESSSKINPDLVDSYFGVNTKTSECVPMYLVVPCGKCLECAVAKQNEWKNRMILEQSCHKNKPCFFLTLTYNNENLPKDGVSRDDARDFVKRLHDYFRHHGLPSFRIALFSEYGSLHGRPHYHAVIFGFHTNEQLVFKKRIPETDRFITHRVFGDYRIMKYAVNHCWRNGYTYTVNVRDFKAFGYISKYVAKNIVCPLPSASLKKNFVIASRNCGIGGLVLDDPDFQKDFQRDYPRITVNCMGQLCDMTLPTYLRRKICPDRSTIVKSKYIRLYKTFVSQFVRFQSILDRSEFCISSGSHQLYSDIMQSLYKGLPSDVFRPRDVLSLVTSHFPPNFFPFEYTDYEYMMEHYNKYHCVFEPDKFFDKNDLVMQANHLNDLCHKILSWSFPAERYHAHLRRCIPYKLAMQDYMKNVELSHPKIYESYEKVQILLNSFKYQYRVKDDQ